MDWLDALKVAIVSQNVRQIDELMDTMPQFDSLEQMEEVYFLIEEAGKIVQDLKGKTLLQMNQIKKNIDFLESTAHSKTNSLDISS